MKILVTGASGFIGNYVIQELIKKKVEVIATSSHLPQKGQDWLPNVKFVEFDLNDVSQYKDKGAELMELFGMPDRLIHLAWKSSAQHQFPGHMEQIAPQFLFLKCLAEGGLKEMTIAGSSFEYGPKTGSVAEDMPTKPNTYYGLAKLSLLKALEILQTKNDFHLRWLRLFNTYGTGTQDNTLLSQLDAAVNAGQSTFNMSGGQQVRDFFPVQEAARIIAHLGTQSQENAVINLCSGKPISVLDFVQDYMRQKGYAISLNLGHYPYRDYESMNIWGSDKKLQETLKQTNFSS